MIYVRHCLPIAFALILAGCSKADPPAPSSASATAAPQAADASASAAPSARSAPAAAGVETWAGTYASAPSTYFIPTDADVPNVKDWNGVKQRPDDAGIGRGTGAITLKIDRATGRVTGSTTGSIGDALVSGSVTPSGVAGTVARKDPTDEGLTGSIVLRTEGADLKGVMRLAEAHARVVREATVTLSRKP